MVSIEQYKQYRQTQVKLHAKILDDCVRESEFLQAARILGILNNQNRVVIGSDADRDALYDFNIYEKIRDGKNTLSLFADGYTPENQLENELIAAMLQSEASLYEVIHVDKTERILMLNDVLHGGNKPHKLIDLSLSECIVNGTLIYTRLLHLEMISITSGVGFIFSANHKDYILNRHRKILKKLKSSDVGVNHFIAFSHLNQSDGLPMIYEDVK